MIGLKSKCIRNICIPGAIFFWASMAVSIQSGALDILLSPPGLRLIKDPSLVIPADFTYSNRLIPLPAYRHASGKPARGWSDRFVKTRRFASDRSAWIYFRSSDLRRSVSKPVVGIRDTFRFWPVGTTMIIEIYKGDGYHKENEKLIEIAAMAKTEAKGRAHYKAFFPANWTYTRFTPGGHPSSTAANVRECHQCHSIAFHLTGDLIFTRFP